MEEALTPSAIAEVEKLDKSTQKTIISVSISLTSITALSYFDQDIIKESENGQFLKEGETYYLISTKWFDTWKKYVEFSPKSTLNMLWNTLRWSSSIVESPGHIENKDFADQLGEVKLYKYEPRDYTIVNKLTWDKLFEWYDIKMKKSSIENWNR